MGAKNTVFSAANTIDSVENCLEQFNVYLDLITEYVFCRQKCLPQYLAKYFIYSTLSLYNATN